MVSDQDNMRAARSQFTLRTLLGAMAVAAVALWLWSFGPLGAGVLVAVVVTLVVRSADAESRRQLWPVVAIVWLAAIALCVASVLLR